MTKTALKPSQEEECNGREMKIAEESPIALFLFSNLRMIVYYRSDTQTYPLSAKSNQMKIPQTRIVSVIMLIVYIVYIVPICQILRVRMCADEILGIALDFICHWLGFYLGSPGEISW